MNTHPKEEDKSTDTLLPVIQSLRESYAPVKWADAAVNDVHTIQQVVELLKARFGLLSQREVGEALARAGFHRKQVGGAIYWLLKEV